jgi:ribosomal protein L40E
MIYVHISRRDVGNALLRVHGIEKPENSNGRSLTPKVCQRCQAQNPYTNAFCSRCGLALDESTRIRVMREDIDRDKADSVLDSLLQDREFRDLFIRKLQGLSAGPRPA